jgi:NAD(P)-dependent dehydrogenase (short-subunit alcohol dehydrogenase family)
MRGLDGKVAVVTGGGSGMGAGAARRLAQEGCNVVVVDWNGDAAEAVAAELVTPGLAVRADVSSERDVDAYMRAAVDGFGRVDGFFLNAGIPGTWATLVDIAADEFDHVIAVDLRSVFLGLRAGLRQLASQGEGGAIVTTSSLAGLTAGDALTPYVAAKHGVIGLTKAAAVQGGPIGVRANVIAPGMIDTPLLGELEENVGDGPSMRDLLAASTPARRFGTPAEVGALVAFLLSDEAPFINGAVVPIDGGALADNPIKPRPAER